jgi:hypothetical protein
MGLPTVIKVMVPQLPIGFVADEKEPKDLIPQAVQHVREFLRKHRPVAAAR